MAFGLGWSLIILFTAAAAGGMGFATPDIYPNLCRHATSVLPADRSS
jgi:hypothetical protein